MSELITSLFSFPIFFPTIKKKPAHLFFVIAFKMGIPDFLVAWGHSQIIYCSRKKNKSNKGNLIEIKF